MNGLVSAVEATFVDSWKPNKIAYGVGLRIARRPMAVLRQPKRTGVALRRVVEVSRCWFDAIAADGSFF